MHTEGTWQVLQGGRGWDPPRGKAPQAASGCCVEAGQGLSRALAAGAWKAEEGCLAGVLGQAEAGLRGNPALRGVWAGWGQEGDRPAEGPWEATTGE